MLTELAPYVPLASTLVWAVLIVGLVVWFRRPIRSILSAIQKRIEGGSTVKAGWFELSDQLRVQSPAEQRENTKAAVAEAASSTPPTAQTTHIPSRSEVASRYFLAEDLALRAVQAEYEVPITRQVAHSSGVRFDAAFAKDGRLHVVEVKAFFAGPQPEKLRASLLRVANAAREMGGPQALLVAAFVVEQPDSTDAARVRATEALKGLPIGVVVRVYSLSELKSAFGVSEGAA